MGNYWQGDLDAALDDEADYLDEVEERNREEEYWTCVFPDRCLCPHGFHSRDECFTAEMAEEWAREQTSKER